MAKLISQAFTKGEYKNAKITLPAGVGVVVFDKDGNVTVPDDKAEALIKSTKDSFDFYDEKHPPIKTPEEIADKELMEGLKEATSEELLALAGAAGIDPTRAAGMTDDLLRKVLISKVKEKNKDKKK